MNALQNTDLELKNKIQLLLEIQKRKWLCSMEWHNLRRFVTANALKNAFPNVIEIIEEDGQIAENTYSSITWRIGIGDIVDKNLIPKNVIVEGEVDGLVVVNVNYFAGSGWTTAKNKVYLLPKSQGEEYFLWLESIEPTWRWS